MREALSVSHYLSLCLVSCTITMLAYDSTPGTISEKKGSEDKIINFTTILVNIRLFFGDLGILIENICELSICLI